MMSQLSRRQDRADPFLPSMENIGTAMKVAGAVRNFDKTNEKMGTLKRKCDCLKSREEDVNAELEYAEGLLLKKRRRVVENWLEQVASIKNEVEQMEQQVRKSSRLYSYWHLDLKIERLIDQATELNQQGQFPDGLTLEVHGNQEIELITTGLIGQKFQEHKDEIWEGLRRNDVSKIGIWGMGGVGKTTLLTYVHNELLAHQDFYVSWVTVSQNSIIQKLQSDIAKTVGVKLENDADKRKSAAKLTQCLKKKNNFVLILDDVWQGISLDEVGIPAGKNGCKLILTSRSLEVCRLMNSEKNVQVTPLSENEGWELFTKELGHGRALSPEIEHIAKSLTAKCCGLPLAIVTMARSMMGVEDIAEWRDALEKLKACEAEHDDAMAIKVFQVLKHSYSQLKNPKVQQCLLYCSLYPEDYEIDRETLIEHFIDERFIDGLRNRQAELDRGHTILNKLENVCLLEGGITKFDRIKYVKMHDLVRSMVIQIGRDNFQYSVKTEEELKKILWEGERASKVSRMGQNIRCGSLFSASPKCPRLTTLILNDCSGLDIIPDCFFSHMPVLSVLDLSRTDIKTLPTSICQLLNLTALWLESCEVLESVPSLDKLRALRKLNLKGTAIRKVPKGLEELSDLRYLNLEETRIKMIPIGILPKLSCLQYLGIDNEFGWEGSSPTLRYDDIESGWCEVASPSLQYEGIKNELGSEVPSPREVRVEELMKLGKLETFKGRLYDMYDFNKYVRWRENNKEHPNNYLLRVGSGILANGGGFNDYKKIACLLECKISKSSRGGEDSDSLAVLPKDVQFLYIGGCSDASSLCDIPSLNNAAQLSRCYFDNCRRMKHVVCCSCNLPLIQSLVSLSLMALCKLRALIGREICSACACASSSKLLVQTPMFSSLQHFEMSFCSEMKRLFMPELLPNFKNLVKLKVEDCENMVEIIGESSDEGEDEDDNKEIQEAVGTTSSIICSLPKLTVLRLRLLPKLNRFCTSKIVFGSLKQIEIFECPMLSFNGDRVQNVQALV